MFGGTHIIREFRGPWGVPIQIDSSLLLLLGFLVYMSLGPGFLYGVVFAAILLGSILLHELGHAWGCLIQGIGVRRVVLHGGGGFCEQVSSAGRRESELILAAGPLVNLGLWALSGIVSWLLIATVGKDAFESAFFWDVIWAIQITGWINLLLFALNMLPLQPLDGGRLLHLALLRILPVEPAARVTGAIGLVLSVAWFPAAIWFYVNYGFILFFVPSIALHYRMMRGDLAFRGTSR